jgi:ubiquinone/menaquinone biosynthesis C-methylase UbiE
MSSPARAFPLLPASLVGVSTGAFDPEGFEAVSKEFLGYFREFGALQSDAKVLDVGCGVGRMTMGLATYLSSDGIYHGFDVDKDQIEWCQQNITPVHPNFHFKHVDVGNTTYNVGGAVAASNFRFPYEDETFDFVFMTSVFTHMMPEGIKQYMAETSRVLKSGGRSFITYFLMNETQRRIAEEEPGKAEFDLPHPGEAGVYRIQNAERPEDVIAFEEDWVRDTYTKVGLRVDEPIRFGSWSGRPDPVSYQDIVVAQKL